MDRGWHCRGCPKGSILLRAGTLRSTGMGSCIVRAIAPTGDVEPVRCSRVHQRPHRRCSGLAGAGRQQAGADGAARRGPRGQEAGGSGSGWTSSRSPVSCREENGVCVRRGGWGPSEHGAGVPAVSWPRVCRRDRLTLLPAPPPAPVPLVSAMSSWCSASRARTAGPNGLSNAHSSQGHSCRNHSSASPPQAPQHSSAWCRHQRQWKAVPGAAVEEGKGLGYRDFESSKSRGAPAMQEHVGSSSLGSGLGAMADPGGSQRHGHGPLPGHPQVLGLPQELWAMEGGSRR